MSATPGKVAHHAELDELAETALERELLNRQLARSEGRCDYCGRRPSTRPCKMTLRHHDHRIEPSDPCRDCAGGGVVGLSYCVTCQGGGIEP